MRRYAIDASVAAAWYFPEDHTGAAEGLLEIAKIELMAPDLLQVEMTALLQERIRREEIDPATAELVLEALRKAPIQLKPASDLSGYALSLMLREGLDLQEAFYLALAVQSNCPLVTADRRLFDHLRSGPLARHVVWIADLA